MVTRAFRVRSTVSTLTQLAAFVFVAALAFGQGGSGTITGTVSDPGGAVVTAATVEARNTATGVVFAVESSNTGNYTISQLPVGTYVVTVKVQGFKTYTHSNLAIAATQVIREDITLEVGSAADTVNGHGRSDLAKNRNGRLYAQYHGAADE